ncbi:HNH endonuclease [Streptomyces prasinus]|uniref:HNH endonuclease n=1 Tax=Streptomyces prasinus TaxID=67345 RepID=UPI0033B2AA34
MTKRTCDVPECERPPVGRGLCRMHYQRMRTHGTTDPRSMRPKPEKPRCSVEGCDKTTWARGLCPKHYQRLVSTGTVEDPTPRTKSVCSMEDCDRFVAGRGYCSLHYGRFMRSGDPNGISRQTVLCSVSNCERRVKGLGFCQMHLNRSRKGTDLNAPVRQKRTGCVIDGCEGKHVANGLCGKHYQQEYSKDRKAEWASRRKEQYAAATPGERATRSLKRQAWYQRNKTKVRVQRRAAYVKQYAEDPHPWRAAKSRRRMRLGQAMTREDGRISTDYRRAIVNDPCRYCGVAETECVDHFFPLAKGGTDHWWNLVRACTACNGSKHSRCGTWFMLRNGGRLWTSARSRCHVSRSARSLSPNGTACPSGAVP